MFEAYLGEIRAFAGDTVPQGWLPCNGQELQIRDNTALYSLLGPMYGGNGTTTYALPDLRARIPVSAGDLEQGHKSRAASDSAQNRKEDQPFLALNFCICAEFGVFPPRP